MPALDALAAALLFALMLLTCADVGGRYFFNAPVNGATELTRLLMVGVIFAALPVVTRREDHVSVDLLDRWVPRGLIGLRQIAINALCALALAVICWRVWLLAGRHLRYGDRTEFLEIPVAPVVYFIALMCAAAAVAACHNVWLYLRGRGALSPPPH